MRSLWWKLLSAFALVVGLSAVVNATMVSLAAREQYFRFVAENNQAQAKALAAALADYYDRNGSWQGIEVTLLTPAHKDGGETASLPGWWSRWHSGDQGDWGPPWARP
jgi:hypothetical protein